MEDTLLPRSDNIKEDGEDITADEDMTPCLNSMVVINWVEAIGSAPLVEHESVTLGSLQKSRISENIDSLLHVIDEQQQLAHIDKVEGGPNRGRTQYRIPRQFLPTPTPPRSPPQSNISPSPSPPSRSVYCKLCRAYTNHFISTCPSLTPADRSQIAKARLTSSNQDDLVEVVYENVDDEYLQYEEEVDADPTDSQD